MPGYYEVNIVAHRWILGSFLVNSTYKYYTDTLEENDIAIIWQFISNNRLMAAKQKISFCHCTVIKKSASKIVYGDDGRSARDAFKTYWHMFEPEFKLMQMSFSTPRDRVISVSITHRKQEI